jgi:hydrogenase maturation protein HypF
MELEALAMNEPEIAPYPMRIIESDCLLIDWQPMLENVLADLGTVPTALIAARIHHSLASWVFAIAGKTTQSRLVLSGGCFQNAYLVKAIVNSRQAGNYSLYRHERVPPNDGGLALGQLYAGLFTDNSSD